MTGYEEQLHARAEMLDETGELAAAITAILASASGAGIDPRATAGLRAAVQALDPAGGAPGYQAGSRTDRHPGSGYGSDGEFLEAIRDAEDQARDRQREVTDFQERVAVALDSALRDLEQGRRDLTRAWLDLAAARAMPTQNPCEGCHAAKAAAIGAAEAAVADAQARISDAKRRISICESCAEILDPLAQRFQTALARLRQVPADLGEVYELVYDFIRGGGKLPVHARWIEGEGARV